MSYSAPAETVEFDGILFDMDGTIIDSTDAVVKNWHRLSVKIGLPKMERPTHSTKITADNITPVVPSVGKEIGVDPEVILRTSHGRRTIDILKIIRPDLANWTYVREMESTLPKLHGQDAVEIPGARAILESVIRQRVPWAIVTSASAPLVSGWLDVLKLPHPEHLVSAESVEHGKPDPACYLAGREIVGLSRHGARVLVVEDSPAGISAGKAAGCEVLGLVTSHAAEEVMEADWVVKDLESVRVVAGGRGGKVKLEISKALLRA